MKVSHVPSFALIGSIRQYRLMQIERVLINVICTYVGIGHLKMLKTKATPFFTFTTKKRVKSAFVLCWQVFIVKV